MTAPLEEALPAPAPEPVPQRRSSPLRTILGIMLALIAGVLVASGALSSWAATTVISTSGFVSAVGPLSSHPAVTQELTTTVTDRVLTAATDAISKAPPPVNMLAGLVPQMRGTVETAVGKVVASETAATAWTTAVTTLHDQSVAAARGEQSSVSLGKGTATIDLNALRGSLLEGIDVPDALKGVLGQLDLGSITVTTGVSAGLLSWGIRVADSWQLILLVGIVLVALAAIVTRRAAIGLIVAGLAILGATALEYNAVKSSMSGSTPPDALSREITSAIMGSLQPSLTHAATLAAMSGAVVLAVGVVLAIVGLVRRR